MSGLFRWLAQWRPRHRRALAKRRLENAARRNGCSKAQALAIVAEYFA
jgi:hypothetical protein